MGKMALHQLQCLRAGKPVFVVVKIVFRSVELIGMHLGISHEDHPVFLIALLHEVIDGDVVAVPHLQGGILEEEGVDNVVKIISAQLLQMT